MFCANVSGYRYKCSKFIIAPMIHDRGSDMIRGDHGSVWVGFVPNLRLNRPSWVPIFQTRRQPVRKSDQIRRFLPESGRVSIGVDYLENGENPAKKI